MPNIVGVDIGGTKIVCGQLNSQGKIHKRMQVPTEVHKGRDQVVQNVINCIREVFDKSVKAIGVSVPAPVDLKTGIVYEISSILDWKNVPLQKILTQEFKVKVFLENDANCFVLAEHEYGVLKKHKNAVCLTVGTGLGAGLLINGKLYTGQTNAAGQIGKIPFRGISLEEFASGQALKRLSKFLGKQFTASKLAEMARRKKGFAKQVFSEYGRNLGIAISILVNTLDPEVVVLGGSVSESYLLFKDTMMATLQENIYAHTAKNVQIVQSKLKDVGVLGAGLICK